ncbi:AAA family ATPase [Candidatus Poribacteria bacterium]|nr:AAA family ATPase [Candidatus Poribacteria bacterium]
MNENKDTQQHPKVEIAVKNFGPIAEANIDLRPLTVFVGPSNTGKTYFATLVYALHGVLAGFPRYPLLNHALFSLPKAVFGSDSFDGVIETMDEVKKFNQLVEKIKIINKQFKFLELPQDIREKVRSELKNLLVFEEELKRCFDLKSIAKLPRSDNGRYHRMDVSLSVSEAGQELWAVKMKNSGDSIIINDRVNENMVVNPVELIGPHAIRYLRRYYLPSSRSGIMQNHKIIASSSVALVSYPFMEGSSDIATLSGGLADFLRLLILYEEPDTPNDELFTIAKLLETGVLAGDIVTKSSPSGHSEFLYRPQGMEENILVSQASSMVSELAPLVLFLRSGIKPGDTLIIEEPEAHLHPGAQADMAVILARLVRAGVKVIITTHSDWLLQEISNLTLEGLLEEEADEPSSWLLPEEVGVWHFQKDQPVKEIPFKPREGISPEDYEDVAEGLYNRSVNLQQKLEKKKGKSERESV